MPTVEEKLQSLRESLHQIDQQDSKSWNEKVKAEKELKANREAIANLEKYQQFQINDWVTNEKEVGQVIQLNLSPGGMPEVWVSWENSVPIPEHILERLKILKGNWNHGLSYGDEVLIKGEEIGTVIKFQWSEEDNCVLPLVKNNQTGEQELILFEDLCLEEKSKIIEVDSEKNWVKSGIKIIIDQEFKSLIPVLSPEEKSQLESNLIREGCRDPLVIWKGYNILLDGHNRYEICVKNGLNYELIEIELPSREDAHLWMMRNQLGRRNLQPEALSYFRGKLQEAVKKKIKNPTGKNQYGEVKCKNCTKAEFSEKEVKCKNDTQKDEVDAQEHIDTATNLAQELKVSRRTIYNDARYAKAVDQIAQVVGNEIRPQILSRTTGQKLSKNRVLDLGKKAVSKPEEVIEFFNPNPVQKFLSKSVKPFPFQVGEVVKIIPKSEPDLRGKGGYWAIITEVHLTCCNLQLWNSTVELVSAENLVSLQLTPSECEQMKTLGDRLLKIREKVQDPMVFTMLKFLGQIKHPKLTNVQETILKSIENIEEEGN